MKDSDLVIKIQTPYKTYNLQLERLNKTLLHKDFKVLHVFTDPNGKTVFHEDTVKVTLIHFLPFLYTLSILSL